MPPARVVLLPAAGAYLGCSAPLPPETIGSTRTATLTSYSVSTRSPVSDDTEVTQTASVGLPGQVDAGDEGVCWISKISGSFRGNNEYARILVNGNGYYYATVRSNTAYDSVTGVGPAITMKCRHLTDFMDPSDVSDFATIDEVVTACAPPDGGSGAASVISMMSSTSFWPWAGIDGRLDTAAQPSYNTSTANKSMGGLYASVAKSCPLAHYLFCGVTSATWETYSISGTRAWSYVVQSAAANNDANVTLSNNDASTMECFIDGVNGEWNAGTSAEVLVGADNKWHLVTAKGGGGGMGARASCVSFAQGF